MSVLPVPLSLPLPFNHEDVVPLSFNHTKVFFCEREDEETSSTYSSESPIFIRKEMGTFRSNCKNNRSCGRLQPRQKARSTRLLQTLGGLFSLSAQAAPSLIAHQSPRTTSGKTPTLLTSPRPRPCDQENGNEKPSIPNLPEESSESCSVETLTRKFATTSLHSAQDNEISTGSSNTLVPEFFSNLLKIN